MSTRALERWLRCQSVTWLALLTGIGLSVAFGVFEPRFLWGVLVTAVLSYAWLWRALAPRGTVADLATAGRFVALVGTLAWIALAEEISWLAWIALGAVVLSDLVDGWCARRFGGSEEGALLDMETDQLTTLVLSVLACSLFGAGLWCLFLPGVKYVFALAMLSAKTPANDPKPQEGNNLRGKLICALVMALLLFALLPASTELADGVRQLATGTAVALLMYSFSADAIYLLSRVGRPSTVD